MNDKAQTTKDECIDELLQLVAELPAGEIAARLNSVTQEIKRHFNKQHWSDCAVHNEPDLPKGECNCGGFYA